jgi:DNA-binding MarR family transcriptional regulator
LSKLEEAGLVETEKRFVNKKTQTLVRLTGEGRGTIESYWKEMEELRESAIHWQPQKTLLLSPG